MFIGRNLLEYNNNIDCKIHLVSMGLYKDNDILGHYIKIFQSVLETVKTLAANRTTVNAMHKLTLLLTTVLTMLDT